MNKKLRCQLVHCGSELNCKRNVCEVDENKK